MPGSAGASVCLLSYNHARFLPAAIESALAQTYADVEVIVVDDGSTDGSLSIAESYAARHPRRLQVFTHPGRANRGIGATSNLAFEKATGAYWSVLGSDDEIYPHKIAEQVRFLERHPAIGWTYGYAHWIDERGGRGLPGLFGGDVTRARDPLDRLVRGNTIPAMTVLARRACLERIGREAETLVYSDWDLWIRLLAHAPVAFLPRVFGRYRVHGLNVSVGVDDRVRYGHSAAVLEMLRRDGPALGGALARPRLQALADLQLAYFRYRAGDEPAARARLAAAFTTDPALRSDAPFLARWLAACRRDRASAGAPDFGPWALHHLPPGLDPRARAAMARVAARKARGPLATRAALYWRRRHVLSALMSDRHAWRHPELRAVYFEALVGQRVGRRLFGLAPHTPHGP